MAKLKLSPPWIEYYEEVQALFKMDPDVHVILDDEAEEKQLKIYVESPRKAAALGKLFPTEKEFGGVKLAISVIPANDFVETQAKNLADRMGVEETFISAFGGNPVFSYTRTVDGVFGFTATFVIFQKRVIQFFDDNISDINGMKSTLAENIARDIFNVPTGVFFCTDVRDINEGAPYLNCQSSCESSVYRY